MMDKKLLFTGASGFLGANILKRLKQDFSLVRTLGHLPNDDINVDLKNEIPVLDQKYDIVLHAAGKAHIVPKNKEEIQSFYDVNYEGTKNLCYALENVGCPQSFIFISTVAVYGQEKGLLIEESCPLNGKSPYAKSKIMAESFLKGWCKEHNVILTILRPSLIAGINPPGNLGDMIRGIKKGLYVNIDGGRVQKSILMAEDIANLIPLVKDKGGIYNVCDSEQPTFGELSKVISKQLGKKSPVSIPYWIALCFAKIGDVIGKSFPIDTHRLNKLTQSLTFSNRKAMKELGWIPLKVLENLKI